MHKLLDNSTGQTLVTMLNKIPQAREEYKIRTISSIKSLAGYQRRGPKVKNAVASLSPMPPPLSLACTCATPVLAKP